jgi:predicted nucleic acid-binding protein
VRRITLDSNVLIYAALEPQTAKGQAAARLIDAAAARGIIAAQALGEFLNVVRRRAPKLLDRAVDQVAAWMAVYVIAPTDGNIIRAGGILARRHRLQIWDAVIWAAARDAGATVFLSEDLHDGLELEGMRVVNPFAEHNATTLADLLDAHFP